MIELKNKEDCCGCNGCVSICPKHCISMSEDNEGFLYPDIDLDLCIDCHLCENVCPVINQGEEKEPISVYAAKSKNKDIIENSSSGGMFTELAEFVLSKDGVVFGVCVDERGEIVHDYAETSEGISKFRGSKYVQSNIGNTYILAKKFLKEGRIVLFSGAPCQIAGLNLFLNKSYENLLTVDFVCHGVPSPGLWREYLEETIASKKIQKKAHQVLNRKVSLADLTKISFRNKNLGWRDFSFVATISSKNGDLADSVLINEPCRTNPYVLGFLRNLYLRPSCHYCPSKSFKNNSDITLADFWGIEDVYPSFDDDRGTSLVLLNSEKGTHIFELLKCEIIKSDYHTALKYNSAITESSPIHPKRELFFSRLAKNEGELSKLILFNIYYDNKQRYKAMIRNVLDKMLLLSLVKLVLNKVRNV